MKSHLTRRTLLKATAAGAGLAALPWTRSALAQKATLVGVTWGGPWIEGTKKIADKWTKSDFKWELHSGGAAAITPKIAAVWPQPLYDFVMGTDPHHLRWTTEGWTAPITAEEMPNLKDVPADLYTKNSKGEITIVPTSVGGNFFGYRKDICPFPIKKMEDLLDPRLKGKVCVRHVLQGLNSNVLFFALAFGGSDRNMEPGWDFLKKLAKSGNVSRIANSEVDFINSMTSGESAVGFNNNVNWAKVAENFPCEFLIRARSEAPGFQANTYTEGFMICKNSPRVKEAKEFLNFLLSPENNEIYNAAIKDAPANVKSKAHPSVANIVFRDSGERKEKTYYPDNAYLATQQDAMAKKWEQEIVPILK